MSCGPILAAPGRQQRLPALGSLPPLPHRPVVGLQALEELQATLVLSQQPRRFGKPPRSRSHSKIQAESASKKDLSIQASSPAAEALTRKRRTSRTTTQSWFERLDLDSSCSPSKSTGTPASSVRSSPRSALSSCRGSPPRAQLSGCWKRGDSIGRGSFGAVYKALDAESLRIFAVKECLLEEGTQRCKDKLDKELHILEGLHHKNIIGYFGHEYTETHLLLHLEYAAGGSIASLLAEFGPLSGTALKTATAGILEGLHYLHNIPIPVVHRDIKGANVLLTQDFIVKLTDFGCSKCDVQTKSFTTVGSIPWMAPEVINQKDGGHGRKADIWSLGCTVIEMVTAERPWGNDAFNNMMHALNHVGNSGKTPPVPDSAPGSCQEFICACTQLSQHDRPAAVKLLQHPFLAA